MDLFLFIGIDLLIFIFKLILLFIIFLIYKRKKKDDFSTQFDFGNNETSNSYSKIEPNPYFVNLNNSQDSQE